MWVDLLKDILAKGVVPLALLIFWVWLSWKQADRTQIQWTALFTAMQSQHDAVVKWMREDLIASRVEGLKLLDKLLARNDVQATEVKAAVKEVKAEVKATTEAVKAAAPASPTP